MIVYEIIMSILVLLIAPVCVGSIPVCRLKSRSLSLALIYGYVLEMVLFEFVTVPVLLLTDYSNFRYVVWIYTPLVIILSVLGIILARKTGFISRIAADIKNIGQQAKDLEQIIVWGAAIIILAVMLVLTATRVIFDGDDAYYVVQSLTAWQKGTMYASNPYTGRAAAIDMRHALAVFTMWISYVGSVTKIHTTILCHSVLPAVFIPLTVTVYARTASEMMGENRNRMLGYFVIFVELFILFGRVSLYTPETFLIARTWQGKAVAANILLPVIVLTWALIYGENEDLFSKRSRIRWILLLMVNASAGIYSSLAVVLASVMIAAGGAVLAFMKRKVRVFVYSCLCCLPGVIYMLLYLYYTYLGWR